MDDFSAAMESVPCEMFRVKLPETINRAGEAAYAETLDSLRADLSRLQAETGFEFPPGCGPDG